MPKSAVGRGDDGGKRARRVVDMNERPSGISASDNRQPTPRDFLSHKARMGGIRSVKPPTAEHPGSEAELLARLVGDCLPRDRRAIKRVVADWRALVKRRPVRRSCDPDNALEQEPARAYLCR